MLRLMNSKAARKSGIIVLLMMVIACLYGCSCGRDDSPSEKRSIPIEDNSTRETTSQDVKTDEVQESNDEADQAGTVSSEEPTGEEGGNLYSNDSQIEIYEIHVLVNESEYYYENSPVKLEELLKRIDEIEGEKIVYIASNNASQSAYKKLTDALEEKKISYSDEE